jgi:hypothetical protein
VSADVAQGRLLAAATVPVGDPRFDRPERARRAVHQASPCSCCRPGRDPARDAPPAEAAGDRRTARVSRWWSAQTGGRVRFTVTSGGRCACAARAPTLGVWAEAAASDGLRAGAAPAHLVVLVPPSLGGLLRRLGTSARPQDGGYSYCAAHCPPCVAHELGPQLGLGHSNGCSATARRGGPVGVRRGHPPAPAPPTGTGTTSMGVSWTGWGSLSHAQAYALGVLGAGEVTTVTARPASPDGGRACAHGLRSLRGRTPRRGVHGRVPPAAGRRRVARAQLGVACARACSCVAAIRTARPPAQTLLLDASPSVGPRRSRRDWDASLRAGAPR